MSEVIIYSDSEGNTRLEVTLEDETLWLNQKQIGELYQKSKATISEHISNIFEEEELFRDSVVRNSRTTAADGKNYDVDYYNLDMIIAVGFRVRSRVGTQFRRWANERLGEYIVKGFTMDDERLKNPPVGESKAPDHFDEMLERIRDIRASERRMYLRVREIFALAADYNPTLRETTRFFQTIQNKLHYTVTHKTAAELIAARADHSKPNMGLTSYKGDEVQSFDVTVAKNYLNEEEIDGLNRIVTMWLDYAEDQAKLRKQVFLNDWQQKLDDFLRFNERDILAHTGKITKKAADQHAKKEYAEFAKERRAIKEAKGEAENIKALETAARRKRP